MTRPAGRAAGRALRRAAGFRVEALAAGRFAVPRRVRAAAGPLSGAPAGALRPFVGRATGPLPAVAASTGRFAVAPDAWAAGFLPSALAFGCAGGVVAAGRSFGFCGGRRVASPEVFTALCTAAGRAADDLAGERAATGDERRPAGAFGSDADDAGFGAATPSAGFTAGGRVAPFALAGSTGTARRVAVARAGLATTTGTGTESALLAALAAVRPFRLGATRDAAGAGTAPARVARASLRFGRRFRVADGCVGAPADGTGSGATSSLVCLTFAT